MGAPMFANLSYESVVRKYAQTVMGVCVMRLQNMADAEDCFQNSFIKLYTKAPDFKDETHLKAWLIRVAINECNNYLRDNRRFVLVGNISNDTITKSEDEWDVSWALQRLSSPYREVLYLHYCERYKVSEIAEILGKPSNTIKTLLKRGREKLKAIYGGDAGNE
ncbi:MAG: RNA polymerase sigma factor [Ruminococcaceae bacterium]|nr:RNA polymerase sigma factor [Oscillospiraceae bacterium]